MLSKLKEKLETLGCDGWEITEVSEDRWEFYFIRHRLDQNRAVLVKNTEVKVYKKSEDGKFLGSASDRISPTASDAEIDGILSKLLYQAGLVKNPVYTLADKPVDVYPGEKPDVKSIAENCIRAFSEVEESPDSDLNSYEIFVSGKTRSFLNSNGVAYTCSYPETQLEVVVNARKDGHEIELYRLYDSGTCDKDKLKSDLSRVMGFARDRLSAVATPALGRFDVLLSTEDAVSVYDYFKTRMYADMVVRKISDWKPGEPVAPGAAGDVVTLQSVRELPNSSMNYPVDREGNAVLEKYLIRDGVAESYCGSRQFSQYMGLDESFLVTNMKVSGGSRTEEELRSGDYLEVVEFSDFHVDPMSGDVAGEIRLGYLHKDGEIRIVTGGSVSGSMFEAAKDMYFTKKTAQYNNAEIPAVTLLKNMSITGAAAE